jgi:hypothetical protein
MYKLVVPFAQAVLEIHDSNTQQVREDLAPSTSLRWEIKGEHHVSPLLQ